MKRERFLAQVYQCIPAMRRCLRPFRFDYDTVNDLVSDTITDTLAKKAYTRIAKDCQSFLCRSIINTAQMHKRQLIQRGKTMLHLVENETELERFYEDVDETEDTEKECPFCFVGILNQYGGCTLCHTILPNRVRRAKELWKELEDLRVEFHYEKKADVSKAISKLTPLQQKIVHHIVMGNETLQEFSTESGYSASTVWREWRKAKLELTSLLADYADRSVSKHGKIDLQACLN